MNNVLRSGPDLRILLELNLVSLKWIIGSHEQVIVAGWTNFSAWFKTVRWKLHRSKKRKLLVYFTQAGYVLFKQNCDKKVVICKILQKNKEKWIFMFFTSSNDLNNILKAMSLNKWSFKCAFSLVSSSFINKHSNSFFLFFFNFYLAHNKE